jgi:hypothetical protein
MNRAARLALAAILYSLAGLSARAQTFQAPLDTFLDDGPNAAGVSVGGWHFDQFTFRSTGSIAVDASDVVIAFSGDPFRNTLAFSWERDAAPGSAGGEAAFDVGYRTEGAFPYGVRAGLRFNGSVPAQGAGGAANVLDTLTLDDGTRITLDVFNDGPGRLEDRNSDFESLNGPLARRGAHASLVARDADTALLLSFAQNLVEPLPDFPEPAALALLAPLALLLRRRPIN